VKYVRYFRKGKISKNTTPEMDGGKGCNLIQMKKAGLPVPDGIVIKTKACINYRKASNKKTFMDNLMEEVQPEIYKLIESSPHKLVSIRSGAPVSMAGMMDTVLNVGAGYWDKEEKPSKFKTENQRRFTTMYLDVVFGMEGKGEEASLISPLSTLDTQLSTIVKHHPNVTEIWRNCIKAVFDSWDNPRAKHYRKVYKIPEDMGTAVVIQNMVFGNYNKKSLSGVMFTRDPNTGVPECMGEYLIKAQGEDVVNGSTTPISFTESDFKGKSVIAKVVSIGKKLDYFYRDMQDIEFTVQDGEVFILQTRRGKRSTEAEVQIAIDLYHEHDIPISDTIKKGTITKLRQPNFPVKYKGKDHYKGIPSGGFIATGLSVFSTQEALTNPAQDLILISKETNPDDIEGIEKAKGIVTIKGGATSHAAVVARGMNKPCVVGCGSLDIQLIKGVPEFKYCLLDGRTGEVYFQEEPFDVVVEEVLPIHLIEELLPMYAKETDWILVNSYEEAVLLEDHLYNVAIPMEGIEASRLTGLSCFFDKILLVDPLVSDEVSDFIGTMIPSYRANAKEVATELREGGIKNIYFEGVGYDEVSVTPYKTMADVMNPVFVGVISEDFITNVMGGYETYNIIADQLGLHDRVVAYQDVLSFLETKIGIG